MDTGADVVLDDDVRAVEAREHLDEVLVPPAVAIEDGPVPEDGAQHADEDTLDGVMQRVLHPEACTALREVVRVAERIGLPAAGASEGEASGVKAERGLVG